MLFLCACAHARACCMCKCICSRRLQLQWLVLARACTAGATWTRVTDNATWAARREYTSVIDAAGYIYVLGCVVDIGHEEVYNYNDVWRADQGAVWHRCATHLVFGKSSS